MTRVEYKVVTFQVYDKPIKWQTTKVPRQVGTQQVVKKKMFGGEETVQEPVYEYDEVTKAVEWMDYKSDVDNLKKTMEQSLNDLAKQGWRVVSIEAILRAYYKTVNGLAGVSGTGFDPVGYSYSLTDAFVVVLEREIAGG